jgi:site-specific DNA-methyltransferase (adenine-specific)
MLNDSQIRKIVDYPDSNDCFKTVQIEGGVCYYIWERGTDGDCTVVTHHGGEKTVARRTLNEFDKFVRHNAAIPILKKVLAFNEPSMQNIVSSKTPFSLQTNFKDYQTEPFPGSITIYGHKFIGHIRPEQVVKNTELINRYKVLLPEANGSHVNVTGKPIVALPGSCCTGTYIICGLYDTHAETENQALLLRTKFIRFLISLRKITQHTSKDSFSWVPMLPLDRKWTDSDLYTRYNLSADEIAYIERTIKTW